MKDDTWSGGRKSSVNRQWVAVGTILMALALVLGFGVGLTSELGVVQPGSRAPNFTAVNVATGDTVRLADYAGSVVLLNIWATWCKPCEEEMPSIQRLHERLESEGLKVVAVSIDKEDPEKVLAWVRQRNLTFEVLQDRPGRIERLYQTTGVPETFIIDRDGIIVKRVIGARKWDVPAELAGIRRLLESKPIADIKSGS
ncbi:MAG: TlpA disulfide reductase family protein [Gemmatimonadales bacterium]